MFRWNKKENKAKLEHKLYLARETPEPIFDLSECGLRNVPSGVYSLCRVFRKEVLQLQSNNLSSLSNGGNLEDLHLLTVLDIHDNEFTHLPNNISLLSNLKVLYANKNQLKKLPSTICNLINVQILNLSDNKLESLPDDLGNMINLREIYLKGNKHLKQLPKTMCRLRRLNKLVLDEENFVYPPKEIIARGVKETLNFIHVDNNCQCNTQSDSLEDIVDSVTMPNVTELDFQAKLRQFEKIKDQKRNEFLEIERQNELLQRQEIELASRMKTDKNELLKDIAEQQFKLDSKLAKVHMEKEVERFQLIEQLQEVEQNADKTIVKLLKANRTPLAQLLEQERQFEENLIAYAKTDSQVCKNDVLEAMQELIKYEADKFKEFADNKSEITRSILEEELKSNEHLINLLGTQNLKQSELISTLQDDNELQKIAVSALLEKSDARSWGLVQQVRLVESQLASLTTIELDRKKLDLDKQINDLAEKRTNLSALLVQLLNEQSLRREQLLSTMKTLEEHVDNSDDYWLRQYQQLLDRIPKGVAEAQNNMNPALVEALLMAGVLHYLPFLSKWSSSEVTLLSVTESDLREVGITSPEDCESILNAFHFYYKQRNHSQRETDDNTPSAPALESEEASAPPEIMSFATAECVICLDLACQIIFVPCGHFCCCNNCSGPIGDCPLCRSTINHKIRMEIP